MENNMKEMNMEELERIAAGIHTEMLTDYEKYEYNMMLEEAKRKNKIGELGLFLSVMRYKYGYAILDDYERTHDHWDLDHHKPAV